MKDKRDIVIVILVVIIFAGGGYFLGTQNREDVKIDSYNAMSDTLYITIGGEAAQIHVITNEKMIIDYDDGTSPREYHLVN